MNTNPASNQSGQPLKALGYCRVSTKEQAEGMSLGYQEDRIASECKSRGWQLVAIYTDIGSGAEADNRPEYQRLLKAIKKADVIVAHKLDRIARNAKEILGLLDTLKLASKGLLVIDMPIDPFTAIGRLVFTIMAGVAELERLLILDRTTFGRNRKRETGGYSHGAPPFGYRAESGELAPEPSEQRVIALVRGWHRLRWSLREICQKLTKEGFKPKRGKAWHPSTISKILRGGKNGRTKNQNTNDMANGENS